MVNFEIFHKPPHFLDDTELQINILNNHGLQY